MVKLRKVINKMNPYIPGKSIAQIVKEFSLKKEDIVKLGSNENPWGPSKKAIEAIEKNLNSINRYPESEIFPLIEEIAKYSNTETDQVIVGGDGADEIIDILGKTFIDPGSEFIVPLPSYMYYEYILQIYEAIPVYAKWNIEEEKLDVNSVLDAITDKTRLIFLCTPNNPTGALISQEDIKTIAEATDALVVVDEAYGEYAKKTNINLIKQYPNILVMKTMSKILGLAGLRVGYALSNKEVIEYMHRVKPVFSLTRPSYEASIATLKDKKFIEESTEKGIESREYLIEEMRKIDSLKVYSSYANYILVDLHKTNYTAEELSLELLKKGFIVRDCTSFKGLDEYWMRVSIARLDENKKFISALKEILL